jgi:hypothetical protein
MKYLLVISLVFSLLIGGCGQHSKNNSGSNKSEISNESKRNPSEGCKKLDEVVYFIPKENCPVVLFFDAQAAGTQFLNRYGKLFEKLNLGVVASNIYRNGISMEEAGEAVKQMIITAQNNGANMEQIYMIGFSGGGKFTQNLAKIIPNVKAVITMGIGKTHFHDHEIPEVNIIGINDLNYRYAMGYPLHGEFGKSDLVILHDGGHEWASEEILEYVLRYCEGGFKTDNLILPKLSDGFVNELNNKLIQFSADENVAKKKLEKLLHPTIELEISWLGQMQSLFQSDDKKTWEKQIQKLETEEKDEHVKERVMGYLSMLNYMASMKHIENGSFDKAENQLSIYRIVDPKNPDIHLLDALMKSKQGKYQEAVYAISDAIEMGCDGYQKILFMNFPNELIKREDFVLTLGKIYPERELKYN